VRVPETLLGRRVKCPSCQATFTASENGVPAEAVRERPEPREELPAPPEERRVPDREADDYEPWDDGDEDDDRPRRRRRRGRRDPSRTAGYVLPPAVCLAVVGALGFLVTLFNVFYALTAHPVINPTAPEWVKAMQQNSVGPQAAVLQGAFVLVNLVIILSAVVMMMRRAYPFAIIGSILAMVNIGTFCCVLGLPVGIWCLIVLCLEDVKASFN
jgi:hypothetical protein